MSKKKRFGISPALTRGLTETINVVEHNAGIFRNVVLPLSRIELDPDNPRKLTITLKDVKQGLDSTEPLYREKLIELEKLKELAHTIKSSGIINPIVVYKLGEIYRVVAGERRCLASILANKSEIEARVFNEKPKGFELKLVQWVENTAREDLTLNERLNNIREILVEYQRQHSNVQVTATLLKNILGLSLSQSSYYLTVLDAPDDIKKEIENGQLRNLDKAALLAGITSISIREQALSACLNGASLKELRNIASQQIKKIVHSKPDLKASSKHLIHMGFTSRKEVVRTIIESVLAHKTYQNYDELFRDTDWVDLRETSKAFRKLIEILELETAV